MNNLNNKGKIAWKDGLVIPASQATLSVEDIGIVHGAAVTEQLRTFTGAVYEVGKHVSRLFHSAELAGIPIAFSKKEISQQLEAVTAHNQSLIPNWQEQGVVLFATPGRNQTYAGKAEKHNPTLMIHTFDLPAELWENSIESGQHLAISTHLQTPDACVPVNAKTRSRLGFYLADKEVQKHSPNARAILLNEQGYVRETGTANLFVVKQNQIWTAPRETVLPGISREIVIDILKEAGYKLFEDDFDADFLRKADEIFTTSTPYCLLGVSQLDEQKISYKQNGCVANSILNRWGELVGIDIHRQLLEMAAKRNQGSRSF